MGVSDRWVRKLLRGMKKEGDEVAVHGLSDRASNRKLSAQTQKQALAILREPDWHDFGPTFASEQLAKRHKISVSWDRTARQSPYRPWDRGRNRRFVGAFTSTGCALYGQVDYFRIARNTGTIR